MMTLALHVRKPRAFSEESLDENPRVHVPRETVAKILYEKFYLLLYLVYSILTVSVVAKARVFACDYTLDVPSFENAYSLVWKD